MTNLKAIVVSCSVSTMPERVPSISSEGFSPKAPRASVEIKPITRSTLDE